MEIWKTTSRKKDNSETDLDGQHGLVNLSGQAGPVNQVQSTRSKSQHGGGGGEGDPRICLGVLGSE